MLLGKRIIVTAFSVALVGWLASCADDQEAVDPVSTDPAGSEDPVAPPGDDLGASSLSDSSFSADSVFFAFDDYTLSMEAQNRLNSLADHMKSDPNAVYQIEGHCDERGSTQYNLALGERRAQSVKNYLVRMGVDPANLLTISYGEERPVAEGHYESAWSQNRRAEFVRSER